MLGEQLQATILMPIGATTSTHSFKCAFALCEASSSQGTYSPAQLAFGYDLIFGRKYSLIGNESRHFVPDKLLKTIQKRIRKDGSTNIKLETRFSSCSSHTNGATIPRSCP
jgi:hypothetical protein